VDRGCKWKNREKRLARRTQRVFLGSSGGEEPSEIFGPKGQESIAQGLPWVLVFYRPALKGSPLTRRSGAASDILAGLFRAHLLTLKRGLRLANGFVQGRVLSVEAVPGTSCQATIMPSLWDQIHSPRRGFH
jgi:hypothetical protein